MLCRLRGEHSATVPRSARGAAQYRCGVIDAARRRAYKPREDFQPETPTWSLRLKMLSSNNLERIRTENRYPLFLNALLET